MLIKLVSVVSICSEETRGQFLEYNTGVIVPNLSYGLGFPLVASLPVDDGTAPLEGDH